MNIAGKLSQQTLKQSMNRARRFPVVPQTLTDLHTLFEQRPEIAATLDSQDTLYLDTVGPVGNRCSVFVSRRALRYMRHCSEVYGDATFTPTPVLPQASQVYVLSTMKDHHVSISFKEL